MVVLWRWRCNTLINVNVLAFKPLTVAFGEMVMPIRVGLLGVLQLVLSTTAFAQSANAMTNRSHG